MQETLIDQGVNLMLFGMGTVFVFLTILIFATTLMSKIVTRFSVLDDPSSAPSSAAEFVASTIQPDANTLSAIQQAIAAHRQR